MKALLLADQEGEALAPLSERTAAALLPVLGKPLVVHAVESLVAAGVREITIAVSAHARLLERELGDGTRYGARFDYLPTRGGGSYLPLVKRLTELGDEFLVLDAMTLRSSFVGRFLSLCERHPDRSLRATADGDDCGLWRLRRESPTELTDVEVEGATARRVHDLVSFHAINIAALNGAFSGLLVRGKDLGENLRVCSHARIRPADLAEGRAFIGRGSSVKPGATLYGPVVLGDHVVIDEKATLRDTVVLQDTYVGPLVELDQAIVWKTDLIRVDTGAVASVTDPNLLADLAGQTVSAALRHGFDRSVALVAAVIAMPLWIWMFVDSLRISRKLPFRHRTLLGNRVTRTVDGRTRREPFEALEAATRVPVLRHLPLLLSVIRGHISLVGVEALAPDEAADRHEDWQRVRDGAPVGLLTPALIQDVDSPEERRILEAMYAETRSLRTDLGWLVQGLLRLARPSSWRLSPQS